MSSLFGNPTGSVFGSSTQPAQQQQQQQQPSSLFGSTANNQNQSSLFGSLNNNPSVTQPQQPGNTSFGTSGSRPRSGLFGSTLAPTQPSGGSGLFGSSTQQPSTGAFGALGTNTQQQGNNAFGNTGIAANQQPATQPPIGSLFGSQNQPQPQQGPQAGSQLGQSIGSRIWQEQDLAARKSIPEQIDVLYSKWHSQTPQSVFQAYLYNTVAPDAAPFYRPSTLDDPEKWEAALASKPNPGAIPILVRGFEQLGNRILSQHTHLEVLRGRLHEINDGLTNLLRRHDLNISTRAAECRRKHVRLNERCLSLAAKVQVLRNRGYAMDSAEEELRVKLLGLEERVFDAGIAGRGEEIWARMVSVRERMRLLGAEMERRGIKVSSDSSAIDEEVAKRAKKILEDYSAQLAHLTSELALIQKDLEDWEGGASQNHSGPQQQSLAARGLGKK